MNKSIAIAMSLFRKRDKAGQQAAVWLTQVREKMEQGQQKFADYLSRKTQYWNRSSWLMALALFILLFGGCCLFLCINIFIH